MMKKGREKVKPVLAHSLLFSKSTKGAVRFNVPIRCTNHYQQYSMRNKVAEKNTEHFGSIGCFSVAEKMAEPFGPIRPFLIKLRKE